MGIIILSHLSYADGIVLMHCDEILVAKSALTSLHCFDTSTETSRRIRRRLAHAHGRNDGGQLQPRLAFLRCSLLWCGIGKVKRVLRGGCQPRC